MGFDLVAANKEVEAGEPFTVTVAVVKGKPVNVTLSNVLPEEAMATARNGGMKTFFREQIIDDAGRETWDSTIGADGVRTDVRVLNQLAGAYLEHSGLPNPYNEDGTPKDKAFAALGEASASKG